MKCQAYGNDFILVEDNGFKESRLHHSTFAEKICSRKYLVGADGVVFWKAQKRDGYFKARIFNADGSEAESSGNGMRCLATALHHGGMCTEDTLYIETAGSIMKMVLQEKQNNEYLFRANLGMPVFAPAEVPAQTGEHAWPIRNFPLDIEDVRLFATILSTGNPHCVIRVDEVDFPTLYKYGPLIEHHPVFPSRTNVEFVRIINRQTVEVGIWERGVGHTFSSGTGSAAAAVACILNGWTDGTVQLLMEGGDTVVSWQEGGDIIQEGKAQFVFQGAVESLSIRY